MQSVHAIHVCTNINVYICNKCTCMKICVNVNNTDYRKYMSRNLHMHIYNTRHTHLNMSCPHHTHTHTHIHTHTPAAGCQSRADGPMSGIHESPWTGANLSHRAMLGFRAILRFQNDTVNISKKHNRFDGKEFGNKFWLTYTNSISTHYTP